MRKFDNYIMPIYWSGVVVFAISLLIFLGFSIGGRLSEDLDKKSRLDTLIGIRKEAIANVEPQVLERKTAMLSQSFAELSEQRLADIDVVQFAQRLTEKVLDATRKSDRKLSKPKAEALLEILRQELALPPSEAPEESIQAIRARLISLTEMMVEVQSSLTDVKYKVEDVEAIVDQLPEILRNQRDHMRTLDRSIENLIETTATKSEVRILERELASVKWATATAIGILFTVVGWIMAVLMPKTKELRTLKSTKE